MLKTGIKTNSMLKKRGIKAIIFNIRYKLIF